MRYAYPPYIFSVGKNVEMTYSAQDVVPISEARARLTELSDEVVNGAEKLLTRNGSAYVALVDARKLDYYHVLEKSMPAWCG